MITIDFDSANIPAGSSNVSCILKCKDIRLQARGYIKNQKVIKNELVNDKNFKGSITIEDLMYKDFKVMLRTGSLDNQATVHKVKQVILLPNNFKDWTGTLKK